MASISPRKKAMMIGAAEGGIAILQPDEESSILGIEKQDMASLEAQITQLQKEKEDMKIELDKLRSEKEAAENNFNRLKNKVGEAEGNVNEVQMYGAPTKFSRPFDAQLLQEIPNEITLDHICTKLPWSTVRNLSSVNRCWREAIQSHRIYNARVHAQSTETLVCVTTAAVGFEAVIGVYSLIEDSCCQLPLISNLDTRSPYLGAGGLPACCKCVSLDGKIYVLGGTDKLRCDSSEFRGSAEVYVLDVAGQRPWKQVASMQEARTDFAACVKDGRIYVSGGMRSVDKPAHGSEVYDPEVDEWSPIMRHKVAVYGEKLLMFDGECHDRVNAADDEVAEYEYDARVVSGDEVYHLAKNECRVIQRNDFVVYDDAPMFTANGKPYLFNQRAIYSLGVDGHGYSWTNGPENSFPTIGLPTHCVIEPCAAVAVNDEVLVILNFFSESDNTCIEEGTFLLQSIGFNREDNKTGPGGAGKSLKWQKLNCSLPLEGLLESGDMFCIQL